MTQLYTAGGRKILAKRVAVAAPVAIAVPAAVPAAPNAPAPAVVEPVLTAEQVQANVDAVLAIKNEPAVDASQPESTTESHGETGETHSEPPPAPKPADESDGGAVPPKPADAGAVHTHTAGADDKELQAFLKSHPDKEAALKAALGINS